MIVFDTAEAALVPALFCAATVKLYCAPFTRPVTVHVSAPDDQVQVCPLPPDAVTT